MSGIWGETDPERVVELRKQMRAEERELKELAKELASEDRTQFPVNVNTATAEQLKKIKGIGPAYSEYIIEHRPYRQLDDLYEIKSIPSNTVKRTIPFLEIGSGKDS